MEDVIYRASEVALGYGSHVILRGVNLEICSGQFWSFLGPNGSGKTTLLRGFLGELKARAGSARLTGVSAVGESPMGKRGEPPLPPRVMDHHP